MTSTSTTTRPDTTTTNDADEDNLAHLFCGVCWRVARSKAKPRTAICGRTKYVWTPAPANERPLCVVCTDLAANKTPCPVCGTIPNGII